MTVAEFVNSLGPERKLMLSRLRELILKHDRNVTESVERTMGHHMIVYRTPDGIFKYAVSSTKAYVSFHSMVMYCSSGGGKGVGLREKYQALLPKAKFQKGCINFEDAGQMPVEIIGDLIRESALMEYPPALYKAKAVQSEARRQASQKRKSKR